MIIYKPLTLNDTPRIVDIDRREEIPESYRMIDGKLVVTNEIRNVAPNLENKIPGIRKTLNKGGVFIGVMDTTVTGTGGQERLVGLAVLDSTPPKTASDSLILHILHVSREYRGQGIGKELLQLIKQEARLRGAKSIYISANRSKHSVDFYLKQGSILNSNADPDLFKAEPIDIHLLLKV
jgi:GNAT superfamily N-acetyltransferase